MPTPTEAVQKAQEVEESVRLTASVGDRAITQLRHLYHLPVRSDGWIGGLALRLSINNKDYRRHVKQELRATYVRLHYLYARQPGQPDAFQALTRQVTSMSEACGEARRLYEQFTNLREASSRSRMRPDLCALLQKSAGRLERGTARLQETDVLVRERFDEWKVYFIAVCTKGTLDQLLAVLHKSKIHQATFAEELLPLCKRLAELRDERLRTVMALTTAGFADATLWMAANAYIPEHQMNAHLAVYEEFRKRLQKTNDDQVGIIQSIENLLKRAQTSPTTLHVPHAMEISVDKLMAVFGEYEGIRALSSRALEAAHEEVLPALKAVLAELRAP